MKKIVIFDLDHTVINSANRVNPCILPNGDLDLNKYLAHACTRQQVYTDKLLPLADVMRAYITQGVDVAICTARHMYKHDYDFLKKHGLKVPEIYSRDKLYRHFNFARATALYVSKDAEYKAAYLAMIKDRNPQASLILYDDHAGVLSEARKLGVLAIDAIKINNKIESYKALSYNQPVI